MRWNRWLVPLILILAVCLPATVAQARKQKLNEKDWTHIVEVPIPPRRGKEQAPAPAGLWLPKGVKTIRGLYYPGNVMIERKLATNAQVRAALAEEQMGILHYPLGAGIISGGHKYLENAMAELAEASGHPEVEHAPLLTAGHSAAGLFCRNVAYWKPHRVIAVVMIKSGNFHHAIEDMSRSLSGVPLIHFSGEFEEYGPEGGDLGRGLRSQYATTVDGKTKNQTQWVMTRMQMLDRRRKHEDNVWSLVVHRGGGHTAWNQDMTNLFIQYIHSVAKARIPKEAPDGKADVRCIPMTAKDGWLYDADIKNPKHEPAPYAEYKGDKKLAFWAPDEAMARAIWTYHQRDPWSHPDPTLKASVQERFYPPPILRDWVDAPPPPTLQWSGDDGDAWNAEGKAWRDRDKAVAWDSGKQAIFEGKGGRVQLEGNVNCTGLVLGDGYQLMVGEHRLRSRWHARLAEGAAIHVRIHEKSSRGVGRGAAVAIGGNATVNGRLVIEVAGELRPGDYGVFAVGGIRKGDFSRIAAPEGYNVRWVGNACYLTVPKPLTPQEKKRLEEEAAKKRKAAERAAEPFAEPKPPAAPPGM